VSTAESCRVDLPEIEREINRNTISIAASAPCWPYDVVDSKADIAQVAMSRILWFRADACVGGFLCQFLRDTGCPDPDPEFGFSVLGVNSISADLHKYRYSPKIMFGDLVAVRGREEKSLLLTF